MRGGSRIAAGGCLLVGEKRGAGNGMVATVPALGCEEGLAGMIRLEFTACCW
jgi:hypothetical protein